MNGTKLICPCCGAEFKISEKEHIALGLAIGEDSGLGTVKMPLKTPGQNHNQTPGQPMGLTPGQITPSDNCKNKNAGDRLAALKAAGFDTTGLFALKNAAGEEHLVRFNEQTGRLENKDDDPVLLAILQSDTIPERRLFRRWVTAQMFRLLDSKEGYDKEVKLRGPRYMWEMAVEEYRVQALIDKKDQDPDAYIERHLWFDRAVAKKMALHYFKQFQTRYNRTKQLHEGAVPRKSDKIFKSKEMKKIEKNGLLRKLEHQADLVGRAKNSEELYKRFKRFNDMRVLFKDETYSSAWYDAFRGSGAYFTLKNLILFHGITFHGHKGEEAARCLYDKGYYLVRCGHSYKMFGEMLETLKKNNIDIKAMRAQWAEQKKAAATAK